MTCFHKLTLVPSYTILKFGWNVIFIVSKINEKKSRKKGWLPPGVMNIPQYTEHPIYKVKLGTLLLENFFGELCSVCEGIVQATQQSTHSVWLGFHSHISNSFLPAKNLKKETSKSQICTTSVMLLYLVVIYQSGVS